MPLNKSLHKLRSEKSQKALVTWFKENLFLILHDLDYFTAVLVFEENFIFSNSGSAALCLIFKKSLNRAFGSTMGVLFNCINFVCTFSKFFFYSVQCFFNASLLRYGCMFCKNRHLWVRTLNQYIKIVNVSKICRKLYFAILFEYFKISNNRTTANNRAGARNRKLMKNVPWF